MKKLAIALAATGAIALSAGAAQAAHWLPIVERQPVMMDRIDAALARGDITSVEASGLRSDLHALVMLEGSYRRNGLSARDKLDLDRRYATLTDRFNLVRTTGPAVAPPAAWVSIADRKAQLLRRIDRGVETGDLTSAEAARLRNRFDSIVNDEQRYRLDGLSPTERAELDRRFDTLAGSIHRQRRDRQYGANEY
jgi:hypothetical protein